MGSERHQAGRVAHKEQQAGAPQHAEAQAELTSRTRHRNHKLSSVNCANICAVICCSVAPALFWARAVLGAGRPFASSIHSTRRRRRRETTRLA